MNEELLFRVVFWVLLFGIIVFNRIGPALRAKKSGQQILPGNDAAKNEGKTSFVLRIALFVPFLTYLILYSVYPPFMNALHVGFPLWSRWVGTGFAFAGAIFWIWSQSVLDKYWSPQLQTQTGHEIIKAGPYRVIRHPIYSAMTIWVIGLAFFTANLGFIFLAVLFILWIFYRIPLEERMMIERFGDEYKEYMQNTGGLFPRL